MANISKVLARVFAADLDAAIPLYEEPDGAIFEYIETGEAG